MKSMKFEKDFQEAPPAISAAPEPVAPAVAMAETGKPADAPPAVRQYTVLIPKAWKGPRRLVVPGVGLLALDDVSPALQSKVVTLTNERVAQLRQNGLSVRVLGEKPGQIKE